MTKDVTASIARVRGRKAESREALLAHRITAVLIAGQGGSEQYEGIVLEIIDADRRPSQHTLKLKPRSGDVRVQI